MAAPSIRDGYIPRGVAPSSGRLNWAVLELPLEKCPGAEQYLELGPQFRLHDLALLQSNGNEPPLKPSFEDFKTGGLVKAGTIGDWMCISNTRLATLNTYLFIGLSFRVTCVRPRRLLPPGIAWRVIADLAVR